MALNNDFVICYGTTGEMKPNVTLEVTYPISYTTLARTVISGNIGDKTYCASSKTLTGFIAHYGNLGSSSTTKAILHWISVGC